MNPNGNSLFKTRVLLQTANNSSSHTSSPAAWLPNELLLNIFRHINSYDLQFHVAKVCKRWYVLTREQTLWRLRSLEDEDFSENNLQLLALAPTLNKVSIHTNFPQNVVVKALRHGKKDIQSLILQFQNGCLSVSQLKALLPVFPNLKHLDLQMPSVSHDETLFTAFQPLTKLESLRLNGFVSPVSELLNTITTHLLSLHTLHLVDSLIFFRDEHLHALVSDGRPWISLKLITYFISEAAYSHFACLKDLQELGLIKCKLLTEESLLQIANLPKLHTLKITENCILRSTSLVSCFQFETMSSLHDVDLTVYRADDDVARAIAINCIYLVRLRLAMCLLTDEGLRSIILNSSKLEDLDLECNIIQGRCLHLVPTHLPNLVCLNLHLCYNVLVNLNEIVDRLPTLKVTDPSGIVIKGITIQCPTHK